MNDASARLPPAVVAPLAVASRTVKPQAGPSDGLVEAVALLEALTRSSGLTSWIAGLEAGLRGADGATAAATIERDGIGRETLDAALLIKRVSGQINVLVHTIGILNALPYILEPGERVESLSLGAGTPADRMTSRPTGGWRSSSSPHGGAVPSRSVRTNFSRTSSPS